MRVLIAPDKFKGTLSAAEAARAMRAGAEETLARLAQSAPANGGETEDVRMQRRFEKQVEHGFESRPLADGGEGSHDCLRELSGPRGPLQLRESEALLADPNGALRPVPYLESARMESARNPGEATNQTMQGDQTRHCYLETALAIGLTLPDAGKQSILDRTTAGVGEWLAGRAAEHAANRRDSKTALHLFLGGSGTSDGGFGLARALGFRFLRSAQAAKAAEATGRKEAAKDVEIESFRELLNAQSVVAPESTGAPGTLSVHVYTDVQNPLDGADGAARLFGPQKGASPAEVEELEARLVHLGRLFEDLRARSASRADHPANAKQEPLYRRPGAGAAGGLALPLLYWPAATIHFRSGIDFFLEAAGIDRLLLPEDDERPDLILSGEGATDRGSLQGKVVAGLQRLRERCFEDSGQDSPPLLIVSGMIPAEDRSTLAAAGFLHLYDTNTACGEAWPLTAEQAADRLRETTARAIADFLAHDQTNASQ